MYPPCRPALVTTVRSDTWMGGYLTNHHIAYSEARTLPPCNTRVHPLLVHSPGRFHYTPGKSGEACCSFFD